MKKRVRSLKQEFPSVVQRAFQDWTKRKTVKDIMSAEIVKIAPGKSMKEAAELMGKQHVGSLVVFEDDKPVGIVTERDLLSKVISAEKKLEEVKVGDVMSAPPLTINLDLTIKEAAQALMTKKGRLVVMEGEKLVGIVTAADLIKSMPEVEESQYPVDAVMTKKVETTSPDTTVGEAAEIMGRKRIGSIVVMKAGRPWGIFTERDLMSKVIAKGVKMTVKLAEIASSPLITVPLGTSIRRVALKMSTEHVRRLPVFKGDEMVGIVTARDLVEAYAR